MDNVRILVTGSRDLPDSLRPQVAEWLDIAAERYGPYATTCTVIHGNCRGADHLADQIARANGWTPEPHRADWNRGPRGGPERNQRMVNKGADVCLRLPGADGTANCASKAAQADIPVLTTDIDWTPPPRGHRRGSTV